MRTLIVMAACLALLLWLGSYHVRQRPTPEQLFGCTWEQTDLPSGECK